MIFLLLLTLTSGTIAAGCGAESEGTELPTAISASSITKADFIERANAICRAEEKRLSREILSYQEKHLNEPSADVVKTAARTIMRPALRTEVGRIRALGAPPGDIAEIEGFLTAMLRGVDRVIARETTTFDEARSTLHSAGGGALRYGADQCAR